jgi:serine/threonine protein kinase
MSRIQQVESLFHEVTALAPGPGRRDWLIERCAGDSELLEEVRSLLAADDEVRKTPAGIPERAAPGIPNSQFGAYRAVQLLGHGGMSAVYLARRADGQFEQTVALKIMAGHLSGPEFLSKFDTERQLLASLNHHNIIRLLDGGVSSDGDPYLIAEYVEGQTVDRHCDARKLDVAARIRVFLQVCDAVDYAHRHLIVHRDLKPGNILVNGEGTVKLLDFGTASLLAGQSDLTVTRVRALTPRYASPEQLRGEHLTTATDIYSLGVVLYELLSGAWPFGNPSSMASELSRATGESTPKPPSAVVTEEAAAGRSATREYLSRLLRGDLAAILAKALENDRGRRYESVRQFAADLVSFLEGRPVLARPQTALYRGRKFLRRHWLPVSAAAVFVVGLSVAALVAGREARTARAEARRSAAINEFLSDMLNPAASQSFDPQTYTVAQMLDAAAARLDGQWKDDPLTEASIRASLGRSYNGLFRFDQAKAQINRGLELYRGLGDKAGEAKLLDTLALTASNAGLYEDSLPLFRRALGLLNSLGKDADPTWVFDCKHSYAIALSSLNRDRETESRLLEEAIALAEREPAISRVGLARAISLRGDLLLSRGGEAKAEAAYRQSLETGRREYPGGLWETNALGGLMTLKGRHKDFAAARDLAAQRYQLYLKFHGPQRGSTGFTKITWAMYTANAGDVDTAMVMLREAMPVVRKGFPAGSLRLLVPLTNGAQILYKAGRLGEAESYAREALALADSNHLAEEDLRRADSCWQLGRSLRDQHKEREAVPPLERALGIYDRDPKQAANADKVRSVLAELRSKTARASGTQ